MEAAANTVGQVATIVTAAVRDVATVLGDLATEVFEIREASRKAAEDGADVPIPAVEDQLDEQVEEQVEDPRPAPEDLD